METSDEVQSEIALLKADIERLNEELKMATSEKIQSAQFGLVLLDEKEELQKRYNELEAKYEFEKKDFEDLSEALNKLQTIQRVSATSGIEQEEQLLQESAKKEESFTSTLLELERELKQVKNELKVIKDDRDKYNHENTRLQEKKEIYEKERKKLISELKDFKLRESRLLTENNELDEENISLQKQVSLLKSSQVDIETYKVEIASLQGIIETMQNQIDENKNLKQIAEKQTQDALEALQSEREQKYAIKKELDKKISSETYLNINSFVGFSGLKFENDLNCDASENYDEAIDENNALRQIESEFLNSDSFVNQPPSLEGSLFSEVHINEIKKFEKLLEESDSQKNFFKKKLDDTQSLLEKAQSELVNQTTKVEKMFEELNNLNLDDGTDEGKDPELSHLKQLVKAKLSNIDANGFKNEVSRLRSLVEQLEANKSNFEGDNETLSKLLREFYTNYSQTHDELSLVSEELASIYHHICLINGQTPDRIILNHMQPNFDANLKIEQLKEKLHLMNDTLKEIKSVECNLVLDTVKDQLKVLRSAIDTLIENRNSMQKLSSNSGGQEQGEQPTSLMSTVQEMEDLQDQIVRLKSLLSTKREQIASLRTVLKTNKQTAEVALANLKSKYETEKAVVTETMTKLRNELKALKEDAATFASLRSMFSARCEDYVSQIDELQRKFKASEDEKKTLNSLLRIVIQQKLSLTEKLEELEMDRERQSLGRGQGSETKRGAKGNVRNINPRLLPKSNLKRPN
ncbi:PREDICTED: protein bicaudal D-like [Rhagoletis zephyria]|uniref:protein bicaudal D-like n=1 Tax=Rhagoletis zephyria TaxID=28612 RepID=UPI00081169C3|nr:PREDICTED: protein bicaudal D-like [Rhagoletis zephyria]